VTPGDTKVLPGPNVFNIVAPQIVEVAEHATNANDASLPIMFSFRRLTISQWARCRDILGQFSWNYARRGVQVEWNKDAVCENDANVEVNSILIY
jgi:hypothetical protein